MAQSLCRVQAMLNVCI